MNVSYLGPLTRSWERTRSQLLKPFRLETWLTLGFAAFLSEWMSGGWGQAAWQRRVEWHGGGPWHMPSLLPALVLGPLLIGLISLGVVVGIVLLWLGSRGKFVFLDDVLRGRSAIVEPWNRCARLGNSLFLWKLVLWIVAGLIVGTVLLSIAGTAVLAWIGTHSPLLLAPPIVLGVVLAGLLGLLFAYVQLLLDDFVVPLMLRDGITASAAWRRFMPLFREHPGAFILYGLFVLVLFVVVGGAVVAVGFATCCVGFLLLALPYVAQVVLLPLYVTYRGLGPEFLAQFGPDFDVRATVPPDPPSAGARHRAGAPAVAPPAPPQAPPDPPSAGARPPAGTPPGTPA